MKRSFFVLFLFALTASSAHAERTTCAQFRDYQTCTEAGCFGQFADDRGDFDCRALPTLAKSGDCGCGGAYTACTASCQPCGLGDIGYCHSQFSSCMASCH